MKINLTSADPISLKTDCLVVGILDGGKLTVSAKKADKSMGGIIQRLVDDGDIKGTSGSILMIPGHSNGPARRVLTVGLGKAHESGVAEYKQAVDSAAAALARLPIRNATVTLAESAVAEGMSVNACGSSPTQCATPLTSLIRPKARKSTNGLSLVSHFLSVQGRLRCEPGEPSAKVRRFQMV